MNGRLFLFLIIFIGVGCFVFLLTFGQHLKISYTDVTSEVENPEILYENINKEIISFSYRPKHVSGRYDEFSISLPKSESVNLLSINTVLIVDSNRTNLNEISLIPSYNLSETKSIILENSGDIISNQELQESLNKVKINVKDQVLPEKFRIELDILLWDKIELKEVSISRDIEIHRFKKWEYHGIWT